MDYNIIQKLLNKYLEGITTLSEEQLLKDYFNSEKNIPDEFSYAKAMFSGFEANSKIQYKPTYKSYYRKVVSFAVSTAAIVALFILLMPTKNKNFVSCNTSNKPLKIELDQRNFVWLNSGATLEYSKNRKNQLVISVQGELYFEFENTNNTYTVLSSNAEILVESACKFNISESEKSSNINITVAEGAIKVKESSIDESLTILLVEGYYCSIHKQSNVVFTTANTNTNYLAWKSGNLVFENDAMATVTDILAEYYNVEFYFSNRDVAACSFSGEYKNKSIEFILNDLQLKTGCEIQTLNGVYAISGKPCL